MLPTIGQIVLYRLSEYDAKNIDVRQPQADEAGGYLRNPVAEGQVLPAVVVATFGGAAANLKVLLDGAGDYWATSRTEGDQPGQWSWPPKA